MAGFIGGAIARYARQAGHEVTGGLRRPADLADGITPCITGDLATPGYHLPPVDVVIHAAGLGHRRGVAQDVWQRENVQATQILAAAARQAGARRFILISTAYVHGRAPVGLVEDTTKPTPMDDYTRSKLDGEAAMHAAFGPHAVALRPVAVIGPGCPGNIPLLIRGLKRGLLLPFAALRNQRSFIPVADLANLALTLAHAPNVPPTVLAAHPEAISTPNLIRALAAGLGVQPRLFAVPSALLGFGAKLLGHEGTWQSVYGDFRAQPKAALALGWKPAQSLAESLRDTSRYYFTTNKTP